MSSNEYMSSYMRKRYERLKQEALIKLGGICIKCGSTENLEFDHIDPTTKKFVIGRITSHSAKDIRKELDKCQLLCQSCHQDKTIVDKGLVKAKNTDKHGTLSTYRYCKCVLCRKAKSEYMKVYYATHTRKR